MTRNGSTLIHNDHFWRWTGQRVFDTGRFHISFRANEYQNRPMLASPLPELASPSRLACGALKSNQWQNPLLLSPQGCDPFPNARIARESSTCHPFLVLFAQVDRFTHFSHTIPWFISMSALKTDSKIYFSNTILSTLGSVLALPRAHKWTIWYYNGPALFVDEPLQK